MDGLEGWREFNVAMVGATAALAGLVIVAASVNIAQIVTAATLTSRLASGIAGLVLALIGSALGLAPEISSLWYGASMIAASLAAAAFSAHAAHQLMTDLDPADRMRPVKSALGFAAPACYLVGGVLLVAGVPGLAWLAAGSLVAIAAALVISWVVLVEVLR